METLFTKLKNSIDKLFSKSTKQKFASVKSSVLTNNKNTLYIILAVVGYIILCLMGCHVSIAMVHSNNIFEGIIGGVLSFSSNPFAIAEAFTEEARSNLLSSLGISTLIAALAVFFFVNEASKFKNTMYGKEAGTAEWNKNLAAYNKKYTDPKDSPDSDGPYNMILTQNVFLNMNTYITRRNNNVCVVGGSGSGKSRFFVKPNILQANTNYVITDPAGDILMSTGGFLKQMGYEIKVFNLVEMSKSDCYNPFNYIRDDLGVLMMINCLIRNTTPDGQKSGDPFWEKSETALLQALCFYLIKYRPKAEHNFSYVMRLLRAAEINEQNPNAKSKLDIMFDEVQKFDPTSIALKQYQTFKMGAGRTLKSILISCSVRLTVFNLRQIESLTNRDTLDLKNMGTGKKALFVIIPAADSTYNFLVSMMYSQLFETLYYTAETQFANKKLERHVRFLLDEFANIGQIPEFTQKLATMRKYEISCNIILQNLAQIKTMYKDDWQTIIGNCDSFLFLGGQEYDTLDYVSKELGDQTITSVDNSRSRGKSGSSSQSRKRQGRKLMFADEIARMNDSDCILIIRGEKPFLGNKYEYTKHPNYKFTGDASDEFKYVNTINNTIWGNFEDVTVEGDKNAAKTVSVATANPNPQNKIIGEVKSVVGLAKTINLTKAEDVFKRFEVIPPQPVEKIKYFVNEETSAQEQQSSATSNKEESDSIETSVAEKSLDKIMDEIEQDKNEDAGITNEESNIIGNVEIEKHKQHSSGKTVVVPPKKKSSGDVDSAEEWMFDVF